MHQFSSALKLIGLGIGSPLFCFLPAAWRIPYYHKTTITDVTTIDDAVRAGQRSGKSGWDLVTFAQQLVSCKFSTYSCRNLWDTPERAFAHGMGYCTQYNLALKQILDRLGFQTEAVFSLKVRVFDKPDWQMGHTWLRVHYAGEVRDVCAGRETNIPGRVNFTPLLPVLKGGAVSLFLAHLGLVFFAGVLEWIAWLSGRDVPTWMFVPPEIENITRSAGIAYD